jgi:hypothetical protein
VRKRNLGKTEKYEETSFLDDSETMEVEKVKEDYDTVQ